MEEKKKDGKQNILSIILSTIKVLFTKYWILLNRQYFGCLKDLVTLGSNGVSKAGDKKRKATRRYTQDMHRHLITLKERTAGILNYSRNQVQVCTVFFGLCPFCPTFISYKIKASAPLSGIERIQYVQKFGKVVLVWQDPLCVHDIVCLLVCFYNNFTRNSTVKSTFSSCCRTCGQNGFLMGLLMFFFQSTSQLVPPLCHPLRNRLPPSRRCLGISALRTVQDQLNTRFLSMERNTGLETQPEGKDIWPEDRLKWKVWSHTGLGISVQYSWSLPLQVQRISRAAGGESS